MKLYLEIHKGHVCLPIKNTKLWNFMKEGEQRNLAELYFVQVQLNLNFDSANTPMQINDHKL